MSLTGWCSECSFLTDVDILRRRGLPGRSGSLREEFEGYRRLSLLPGLLLCEHPLLHVLAVRIEFKGDPAWGTMADSIAGDSDRGRGTKSPGRV